MSRVVERLRVVGIYSKLQLGALQIQLEELCAELTFRMEEAAMQLGTSPGNARHPYYRELAKLRKQLAGK